MGNLCCVNQDDQTRGVGPTGVHVKVLKTIKNIEDYYELGDELGKGSFGSVRECTMKGTNEKCAMKVVELAFLESRSNSKEITKLMVNELNLLAKLSHPHIMQAK